MRVLVSTPYEDAGDGFGYQSGEYARRTVICEVLNGSIAVRFGARKGSFAPKRKSVHLELRGVNTDPGNVSMNGEEANRDYDGADGRITLQLAESPGETMIAARA